MRAVQVREYRFEEIVGTSNMRYRLPAEPSIPRSPFQNEGAEEAMLKGEYHKLCVPGVQHRLTCLKAAMRVIIESCIQTVKASFTSSHFYRPGTHPWPNLCDITDDC